MTKDWRYLEFCTPFTSESLSAETKDFIIKGIAINATTTRNGNTYTVEELRKNGKTLEGRPILRDHLNSTEAIVGRVTRAEYSEMDKALLFEGVIKDPKYKAMIADGLINNVSVGAMVEDAEEVVDEATGRSSYSLKGLQFLEVSLVAIPADPNAGFATASFDRAVAEAIKAKKEHSPSPITLTTPKTENVVEVVEETSMETKENTSNADALSAIAETLKMLKEELAELKTKKEVVAVPVVKAEAVDETKGIVSTTETTESNKYILEKVGRSFEMTGDISQFGHARLRRDHQ